MKVRSPRARRNSRNIHREAGWLFSRKQLPRRPLGRVFPGTSKRPSSSSFTFPSFFFFFIFFTSTCKTVPTSWNAPKTGLYSINSKYVSYRLPLVPIVLKFLFSLSSLFPHKNSIFPSFHIIFSFSFQHLFLKSDSDDSEVPFQHFNFFLSPLLMKSYLHFSREKLSLLLAFVT